LLRGCQRKLTDLLSCPREQTRTLKRYGKSHLTLTSLQLGEMAVVHSQLHLNLFRKITSTLCPLESSQH
jgi:hypothetical protein